MFRRDDIVINKHTGLIGKVTTILDEELMIIKPKAKFVKGGFDCCGITALMSNFELKN